MNDRTDRIAADVAWSRPPDIPADLILNYSGPAFAGVEWINRWGKPYLLGFESTTTRAYAGGDAGAVDARQLLGVMRSIPGYLERRCGFWVCAADSPSTPGWALDQVTEYCRRFAAVIVAEVGEVPALAYGNVDAARAGARGLTAAGAIGREWGVGTWGYGEGGSANRPPRISSAALIQSGNTPGPAEGTDLNWIFTELGAFAAHGGPRTTTQPKRKAEDVMLFHTSDDGGTTVQWYRDADGILVPIEPLLAVGLGALDPDVPRCDLGGVLGALAWNNATIEARKKMGLDGKVTVDVKKLATELAERLPAGTAVDPKKLADAVADALAARLAA